LSARGADDFAFSEPKSRRTIQRAPGWSVLVFGSLAANRCATHTVYSLHTEKKRAGALYIHTPAAGGEIYAGRLARVRGSLARREGRVLRERRTSPVGLWSRLTTPRPMGPDVSRR